MPKFLLDNPGITTYLLWGLTLLLGFMVKGALSKLDQTIAIIFEEMKQMGAKQQRMEIVLTEQTTTCEVCRMSCPERGFQRDKKK